MAAPDWKKDSPTGTDATATGLTNIRDNHAILFFCCLMGICPPEDGWTFFRTGTLGADTTRGWTHSDGRKGRITFTYSGGVMTKLVFAYDRGLGAGYETMFAENKTVDANGYTTAATTSAS